MWLCVEFQETSGKLKVLHSKQGHRLFSSKTGFHLALHSPHVRVFGEVELTQHVWCRPSHTEQGLLRRTNAAENGAITTSQTKVTNLHHAIRGYQNVGVSQGNKTSLVSSAIITRTDLNGTLVSCHLTLKYPFQTTRMYQLPLRLTMDSNK